MTKPTWRRRNTALDAVLKYRPVLTPTEWAYLAGILDADGSVSILRVSKPNRYILQPKVSVCAVSEPLIRWLSQKLDMRINSRDRRNIRLPRGRRPLRPSYTTYSIQVWGYRCYRVLQGTLPHMIVKRKQAEAVMAYCERRMMLSEVAYNPPYTEEDKSLWLRVRALNRNPSAPYSAKADLTRPSTT